MSAKEKFPLKIEKPWGYEVLFAHTRQYAGKIIVIEKGHRLSLQYHETKDESIYVCKGSALVENEGSDGCMVTTVLEAGQCFRIPPHMKHRLKAIENTTVFEVSTPELDDVVRLHDDYGRISTQGL